MSQPMIPATDLRWEFLTDAVMGGVSEGRATLEDGALHLTGTVSTKNRGGFLQVRTRLPSPPPGSTGIRLHVRGNGERYYLHLRTGATRLPWQVYRAGFGTGPDWQSVDVPFADFEPSGGLLPREFRPGDVRSVGLVAYGRDHVADVSLAAIGVY